MNAAALLKSQGWRGKGHSLHPTDNSIGLANPLLLSRNTDGRGVGQKPHYTSDQWWLAAFDEKLKGLNVSKDKVVQTATKGKLDTIAAGTKQGKYFGANGLYASFVRGEGLDGTLTPNTDVSEESTDATPVTEDEEPVSGLKSGIKVTNIETREERRARRETKRLRKEARDERRAARAEKRKTAAKALSGAAKEAPNQERKEVETKEERKARRAERRARKEAKRKKREKGLQKQVAG